MILYNAGNFPMMLSKGEESRMREIVLKKYSSFNRLYSFFYPEALKNALKENKEK